MTDFRALCAELLASYEDTFVISEPSDDPLVQQARAALAQPEPQEPTDDELGKLLYYEFTTSTGHGERVDAMGFARAVLARWGNQ